MITDNTIQNVKELAIEQVIEKYLPLQKKGNKFQACCPFHGEKTPSFIISPNKNMFKCFGCGVAGDGVSFVMQHEKLSFPEAIKEIAKAHNIAIEEIKNEQALKEQKAIATFADITQQVHNRYVEFLHNNTEILNSFLAERNISRSTLLDFEIGFAPNDFKFITTPIINQGNFEPAHKLGLIARNEEKDANYDFFRNRYMVPVRNSQGIIAGFGGRKLNDGNDKNPKWLNSTETTDFFEKRKILFGLHLAKNAIRKSGFAIIVEGYMDVAKFHDNGIHNTVGSMGTSFTPEQAKILSRFTKFVVIAYDGDKAGALATERAIDICLKENLTPFILQFPNSEDPDSFCDWIKNTSVAKRLFGFTTLENYIKEQQEDGVTWKINRLIANGEKIGPLAKIPTQEYIIELVSLVRNSIQQKEYVALLKKDFKIDIAKELDKKNKQIETVEATKLDDQESKLPSWAMHKLNELEYNGFIARNDKPEETGFYIRKAGNSMEAISNFIFKFIMHIRDDENDKRILEVNNGYQKQYIDMPTKSVVSLDQFVAAMYMLEGNMLFEGDKKQLFKLLKVLGKQCPIARELKTLGYQREGFFAFSNGIVDAQGKFQPMNQYGMVEFDGRKYYSPSVSVIYQDRRDDNDPYENDRYLVYKQSNVSFEQWAIQFCKVYQENHSGYIGVATVLLAAFRDIYFRIDNNCPHVSFYGESGSGKSKCAESMVSVFFDNIRPINLFNASDFAFANRMQRYRNCIINGDEFNDQTLKEERFENIKSAYDGILRERGTSVKKTEILKTNSLLLLTGQYLSTKDDMAAINRCVIVSFEKRTGDRAFTSEEIENYETLKNWEREGISSIIIDLLKYRTEIQEHIGDLFSEEFKMVRAAVMERNNVFNERVLRNYTALATFWKFFSSRINMPINYDSFFEIIVGDIIKLSNMISNSNALADFWNTIVYLMETGEIYEGFFYKIQDENSIAIHEEEGKGKSKTINFGSENKKVLFIRLTTIHKMYSEAYRRQNGKNGLTMATLELYLKREKGYLGKVKSTWFTDKDGRRMNTSCYIFDYDLLGVNLHQVEPAPEEKIITTITGYVVGEAVCKEVMGIPKISILHKEVSSYNFMGQPTIKEVFTKVYDVDL
jgi:DNA primase catalytic core